MTKPGEHSLPGIVQEALSRVGTLLDTLFETAQDAIFLMDRLRFLDCNPAAVHVFGCHDKDEIIGRTPVHFSPERQPDGAASAEKASHLFAAAMDGVPQHFEWLHRRCDGTELDVEIRLSRCLVGGAPFVVAVMRDVTARKRAEAALRRQLLAEELINDILGRCAICVSSELDAHMDRSLQELASFLGVDHAYFFMISADRATYGCTHEMCGPGVAPMRARHQSVPVGTNAWIERTLLDHEITRIDALDDPAAAAAEDAGRRSLLLVPTSGTSDEFAGALGVDSHAPRAQWSDGDVMLCSIIGNALTGMTERIRAEDRLREEKQFSERLIDSLPGIFYLYDSDLRLRRWNRNPEVVMGYTAAELYGMRLEDWFGAEESRDQAITTARSILQHGAATDFLATELRLKDGTLVPYLCSGARVDSAAGPMLLGVGINLTARVRAEKALAMSERNYRELFDAVNDALFIQDTDGRVLDVNERACVMFGFDADQARGLTVDDLSVGEPPYSRREALDKLRAVHEGPQVFEWRSKRRDGTWFWSEVALRASRIGGDERIIASVRDITERKLAGLERERLMAELQAASSAKDQFLAVLSHELRNPLAAIQAGVGVLRHFSTAGEPRMSHAIDVIERNVKLQARLVNDLLDLSRLMRGKLTIQRAPVRLDEVVSSAVQTCRADAARAGVSLETRAEPGWWVYADADRIQQIVINLVDNGIKFTPRGGRVTVSVAAKEDRAHVTVEDTGIGFDTARLPDLFEMFLQGQAGTGRAPGLGIGLALVKSLAELQEGRVWAESGGQGRGSRFTVELPLCEAPTAREAPQVSAARPTEIEILLVEDNADIRTMLAETLARLGYRVVVAENAEVALEILGREGVDVILADIGLPGMDGYEFLRRARQLPAAAHAPAFALTGHGQESDVRRALEAGYVDHFVKPIEVAEIDQRIRARLQPGED